MKIITHSAQETMELGYKLGKLLKKGSLITLKGDLSGGKTTFTKGIGKALNVKGIINSPTFTILKIYEGDLTLYHIDAYRLKENPYDLGFEEYYDEGVMVVEWPDYYENLEKEALNVEFKLLDGDLRELTFTATDKYEELLKEFEKTC